MSSRQVVSGMAAALFMVAGFATASLAQDQPLLTIVGLDRDISFTRAELENLGSQTIVTTTIWTDGEQEFTGLPLVALVEELGITEGSLRAYAINDYAVDIPLSDAVEDGPLIAHTQNGRPMGIRNNGPLWIVYPYDSNPDYQSEVIYARSIWQLNRIEILD